MWSRASDMSGSVGGDDGADVQELVSMVKEMQKTDPAQKQRWIAFTSQKGGGNRDPLRHDAAFLREFLSTLGDANDSVGASVNVYAAGTADDDLVAQIKEMQRNDPNAKEQWITFTETHGGGNRDPSRHPPEFLQTFFAHMNSGGPLEADSPMNYGEAVKMLQKRSSSFKTIWATYCRTNGGGKNDPLFHEAGYHVKFLDHISSTYCKNMGLNSQPKQAPAMQYQPALMEGPPAKRLRPSFSSGIGVASGGSEKDMLVEQVKTFQRADAGSKELWWQYADAYLGGVRDPSKHDASTLQEFCVNHDVPSVGPRIMPRGGSGASAFGGAIGGAGAYATAGSIGAPIGGKVATAAGGAQKQGLVERIKAFQKISRENAEVWGAFVGNKRDPSKHDAAKLEEFCFTYAC